MNRTAIWTILVVMVVAAILIFAFNTADLTSEQNQSENPNEQNQNDSVRETDISGTEPATLTRAEDTQRYVSPSLGISFYYDPTPAETETFQIAITERDNKIFVHGSRGDQPELGKRIEVYNKPANMSLEQAITDRFLAGKLEQDCWVRTDEGPADNIVQASIQYPQPERDDVPWWNDSAKCGDHAALNAVRYFVMDKNHPEKYLYLELGQDSITTDGTETTEQGGRDWSSSIEIR